VREIADLHEAAVDIVAPATGVGTRVRIRFPGPRQDPANADPHADRRADGSRALAATARER